MSHENRKQEKNEKFVENNDDNYIRCSLCLQGMNDGNGYLKESNNDIKLQEPILDDVCRRVASESIYDALQVTFSVNINFLHKWFAIAMLL